MPVCRRCTSWGHEGRDRLERESSWAGERKKKMRGKRCWSLGMERKEVRVDWGETDAKIGING